MCSEYIERKLDTALEEYGLSTPLSVYVHALSHGCTTYTMHA